MLHDLEQASQALAQALNSFSTNNCETACQQIDNAAVMLDAALAKMTPVDREAEAEAAEEVAYAEAVAA